MCMLCRPVKVCTDYIQGIVILKKKNDVFNFLIIYCRSFQNSVLQGFTSWKEMQLSSGIPGMRMVKCCRAE